MNRLLQSEPDQNRLERMYAQKVRQLERAGANPGSLLFLVLSAEAAALSEALRAQCGCR